MEQLCDEIDQITAENSELCSMDSQRTPPLETVVQDDYSVASSITSGFSNADLFQPSIYPSTHHLQNIEDSALPQLAIRPRRGLPMVEEESIAALDDKSLDLERQIMDQHKSRVSDSTDATRDTMEQKADRKLVQERRRGETAAAISEAKPLQGQGDDLDKETEDSAFVDNRTLILTTHAESADHDQKVLRTEGSRGVVHAAKNSESASFTADKEKAVRTLESRREDPDSIGISASHTTDPAIGAPLGDRADPFPAEPPAARPISYPGAYAVAPGNPDERDGHLLGGRGDSLAAEEEEQQRQDPDLGLVEAQPVPDVDPNTPHATPLRIRDGIRYIPTWLLALLAVFVLLLAVGAITVGVFCGDGSCHQAESGIPVPLPTYTYTRDSAEASNVEWEIKYVLGREYFETDDDSLVSSFELETRHKALHWVLYEDPLQLNTTNVVHLVQRFVLAHFYLSTTRNSPWTECNMPDKNHHNGTAIFCYYPKEWDWNLGPAGDRWGFHWLSNSHECQWAGVTCIGAGEDQQVQEIHISYNRLNGQLPWEISKLTSLKKLYLEFNSLTGTIPPSFGYFDALRLMSNQLEGTIPSELFHSFSRNHSALRNLVLGHNLLTGTIPTEVGVSGLHQFVVHNNKLSGTLPTQLFAAKRLAFLVLKGNLEIHGSLPTELSRATNLLELNLAETAMTGSIPSELGLLSKFLNLFLDFSNFQGTLPDKIYSIPSFSELSISNCNFSGTISSSIGLLSNLLALQIANNNFSGTIPEAVGKLQYLEFVSLNGNKFLDTVVPDFLCFLKGPTKVRWSLVADCKTDDGEPCLECPSNCCTQCCDRKTHFCEDL